MWTINYLAQHPLTLTLLYTLLLREILLFWCFIEACQELIILWVAITLGGHYWLLQQWWINSFSFDLFASWFVFFRNQLEPGHKEFFWLVHYCIMISAAATSTGSYKFCDDLILGVQIQNGKTCWLGVKVVVHLLIICALHFIVVLGRVREVVCLLTV